MNQFVSGPLDETHRPEEFDCGQESLNAWLQTQAGRAQAAGTARTYVWTPTDRARVMAYYCLAPTQVARAELPASSLAGGYSVIPGYLLGRLALDRTLQGQGLGAELLLDALDRIVIAAGQGGGRIVVVDAVDDLALAFCLRHDFIPVAGSHRLYLKIATARLALEKNPLR